MKILYPWGFWNQSPMDSEGNNIQKKKKEEKE
jgi:hypothetical protein